MRGRLTIIIFLIVLVWAGRVPDTSARVQSINDDNDPEPYYRYRYLFLSRDVLLLGVRLLLLESSCIFMHATISSESYPLLIHGQSCLSTHVHSLCLNLPTTILSPFSDISSTYMLLHPGTVPPAQLPLTLLELRMPAAFLSISYDGL